MQCDYTSYWAVCFQEWPEICIFVPRVRRTFLMWLWSLRMVSGWRHTRWSWLPPAASVWQKIAKKNIRIHWSLWEEFRAISNTVGTFDFWRTLSLHLIQILYAIFYAFSSFWSSVSGGEPKACAGLKPCQCRQWTNCEKNLTATTVLKIHKLFHSGAKPKR